MSGKSAQGPGLECCGLQRGIVSGRSRLIHGLTLALLLTALTASADPSADIHAYFAEVALRTETGANVHAVRKWAADPAIQIRGTPTDEDQRSLAKVIDELNVLVAPLEIRGTDEKPNVTMHFVPERDFATVLPEYRPPNRGFHWVSWNEHGEIYTATILVSTTGISQAERSHIIREELTQSLGLLMDSSRYPDSIFYSGWTATQEFSELDRAVIRLLYSPEIQPGTVPVFAK